MQPLAASPPSRAARTTGIVCIVAWAILTAGVPPPLERHALWPALLALGFAFASGIAVPAVPSAFRRALLALPNSAFVALSAVCTAALSLRVLAAMKHQVFALDSAVYLVQARALVHGSFGWPIAAPYLPFSIRFLFEGADGRMHGVFPPGYPLFLAPFARFGIPLVAGPVTAALLVAAQYALGKALTRDEFATRLSVLFAFASFPRALETSDLLSHALVAVLACAAVAAAFRLRDGGSWLASVVLGVSLGWLFSARLLDGVLVGSVCAVLVAVAVRKGSARAWSVALVVATAAPFVVLLAFQQRAATGSFVVPSQYEYFARSDWPADCHRIGFGAHVGCTVEHTAERVTFGATGYTPARALEVVRSRARQFGPDVLGIAVLAFLGFAVLLTRGEIGDVISASAVMLFALGYGLFYYGNAPLFGARHLFPIAPFLWLLVARFASTLPGRPAGRFVASALVPTVALAITAGIFVAQIPGWTFGLAALREVQSQRLDPREIAARRNVARGILITRDPLGALAAQDPFTDGPDRLFVLDDFAGDLALRQARRDLRVYFVLPRGDLGQPQFAPAPAGFSAELEWAWPAFQRPWGLGATAADSQICCAANARGRHVLHVFESSPGAHLEIPIDVAAAGTYRVRVEALVGPAFGRYELAFDDHALPTYEGFAASPAHVAGAQSAAIALVHGRHWLHARCTGRAPDSRGYGAAFDAIIGTPEP